MADNKQDGEHLSTQKTLQSSHDPGWNDPPKWALSSSNATSTSTKRLLNKRVAFPLSSTPSTTTTTTAGQSQQLPPGNLPPPPTMITPLTTAPHAPLFTPTTVTPVNSQIVCPELFKDKDEILSKTMDNLEFVMNNELNDCSKIDDIKKRLEIMKNLWKDRRFVDDIMRDIYLISEELKSNNIEKAVKLHFSLMSSHASVCNIGVSGLRYLIFELKQKYSQRKAEGNVETTQPLLLFNPSSTE